MSMWLLAALSGVVIAVVSYAGRGMSFARVLVPAALRAIAVTLLVALLLDAVAGARRPVRPLVALDASESWMRARGDSAWLAAASAARRSGGDSLILVGDSARRAAPPDRPADRGSLVRPAVERALATGRPLELHTDGEIGDPEALEALPSGSRIVVSPATPAPDAAVSELSVPRAVVAGDTLEARVTLVASGAGTEPGSLSIRLGDTEVASATLERMPAFGERQIGVRIRAPSAPGLQLLRAVVATARDAEPRNDTLAVVVEVSPAAGAVLVSTSPDYDARDVIGVLRGSLALPSRGYYRIAPGMWRVEGSLASVSEEEVRRAVRESPLVVLHGDTALFGAPRPLVRGALALLAPPAERAGEWFATGAPVSPVSGAMSGVVWDSLAPLDVAPNVPAGEWEALETRRARRFERRVAITGTTRPRRTVVVGASGFWRWRFRGGQSAEAFTALWGSLFDWLVQERSDVRAAVPADGVVRAGQPLRWRRGAGTDSVVRVILARRATGRSSEPARVDSVTLRFGDRANVAESAPLPAGVYDVRTNGGASVIAVNASRELLPARATVRSGAIGRAASLGDPPRLRSFGWIFAVLVAALCAEWLLRRRAGMR